MQDNLCGKHNPINQKVLSWGFSFSATSRWVDFNQLGNSGSSLILKLSRFLIFGIEGPPPQFYLIYGPIMPIELGHVVSFFIVVVKFDIIYICHLYVKWKLFYFVRFEWIFKNGKRGKEWIFYPLAVLSCPRIYANNKGIVINEVIVAIIGVREMAHRRLDIEANFIMF